MGTRRQPLRFVCRACGQQRETRNTGNKGVFCDKRCRADFERKGRDEPTRYRQAGYWMLRWNEGGQYRYQFEHRRVWEDANGPIPAGYEIHHKDEDRGNNGLDNLQLMRKAEHRQHHSRKYHSRDEELAARARQQRECRARRKMAG